MTDTKDYLRGLMGRYTVDNVADPDAFEAKLNELIEMSDYEMEGYKSPDHQRDKSIHFEWGHDHDFGAFKLKGTLGERHIDLIATFIDDYGLPKDLTGKSVLDVGVWTGGTTMLLAAMGADVVGIEEVRKYADCCKFLARSFGDPLNPRSLIPTPLWKVWNFSLYEAVPGVFDYVIFAGVLYHVTDPILALRIMFNALKDGGEMFIESMDFRPDSDISSFRYAGGKGWNWFIPSLLAVERMVLDVGFDKAHINRWDDWRIIGVAERLEHRDMLRAGLSNRNIE